jgi:hypothetical protein
MTNLFVYRCFYSKCSRGLTNQLIFLFNTIEYINNNYPGSILFLREFYSQYDDDHSTVPISDIIDIEDLNKMISNIEILDLENLSNTIITWGSSSVPFPKEIFVKMLKYNTDLFHGRRETTEGCPSTFQDDLQDPDPGYPKEICLEIPHRSMKYRFPENCGRLLNVRYTEHMNIAIGKSGCMFTDVVYNICSTVKFLHVPIPQEIQFPGRHCSVLHLRNETDGLLQWSQQNQMTIHNYEKRLNEKYIQLVEKYISKEHDILLILTSRRTKNPVIEHLERSGYWILFNIFEDIGRERMAISDMIFASNLCDSVLISSGGSTYSVLLDARLRHDLHVSLNMNRICEEENVIRRQVL